MRILVSNIQTLNRALIDELIERAKGSRRLRVNHNFHASMEDNPHRFLNVMVKGTYVAPHRHLDPPKPESFVVLEGRLAFFTFDDAGNIANSRVLELNETPAKEVRMNVKDITNCIKGKGAIVAVFEQPILRFPKLAQFAYCQRVEISLIAMDSVD